MKTPRKDFGALSEDKVERILVTAFMADFVARSPLGLSESGKEEEIADFVIPFGETLIAVQVKSREQKIPGDKLSEVELARLQKRFDKGVRQLRTAKCALENEWATEIETLRGLKQPFSYGRFKRIIGIVILDLPGEGEFEMETALDLYGGLDEIEGITAHLFFARDFAVLLEHLTTVPDLIDYLDKRHRLKEAEILMPLVRELDLLAVYLFRFEDIERCLSGEFTMLHIVEGTWEDTLKLNVEDLQKLSKDIARSRVLVDGIIGRLHGTVGYSVPVWAKPPDLPSQPGSEEQYIQAIEALSLLLRVERILFAEIIEKKLLEAVKEDYAYSFIDPGERGCPIVFLGKL